MALGIHEEGGVAAIMRSLDYVHFSTLYLANDFISLGCVCVCVLLWL